MSACGIRRAARIMLLGVVGSFLPAWSGWAAEGYNVWLVGRIPLTASPTCVVGRYAYVGAPAGFSIYDVSNPRSPVALGYFNLYDWLYATHVTDGRVYAAGGRDELLGVPQRTVGIHVRNGLAYAADGFFGLQIVDVTNPTTPTLLGSYNTPVYAMAVSIGGSLAFVADDNSLQIINVTNPSSPTLRGSFPFAQGAVDVSVSGNLALVAGGRLHIVDVTIPSSPVLRSSWGSAAQHPFGIWNVFVSNGVAYATATTGTLQASYARLLAIDVRNPKAPRLLGSYSTPGGQGGPICVSGRYAYASLGDGLRIFDISNPSSPTLRGYYPAWGDVSACGDLVYVGRIWDTLILRFTGRPAQATHWNLYR